MTRYSAGDHVKIESGQRVNERERMDVAAGGEERWYQTPCIRQAGLGPHREQCRNYEWLASQTKSDVSEKSSVQDLADRFPVVRSSVGNAVELTSPWRIHRLLVSGS